VKVAGHGLSIDAPAGWEARIFRREGAAPVLHVATFALSGRDGDFGAAATGRMRSDDAFASLVEYRAEPAVRPGVGLFAATGPPPAPRASDFRPAQLQVTRRGQLGCQRFFTAAGRPFCIYAVIQPASKSSERLASELGRVLRTLRIGTPYA
jgi:hypothetical protein